MSARNPSNPVLWFGVVGGGLAWIVQFGTGLGFTYAECFADSNRTMVSLHVWQTVLSSAGALVGLLALAVATRIFLATGGDETHAKLRLGDNVEPPRGRISFLATCGLVVNGLATTIMIMTAIGAPMLRVCQQA